MPLLGEPVGLGTACRQEDTLLTAAVHAAPLVVLAMRIELGARHRPMIRMRCALVRDVTIVGIVA
jgi:hypothetical protein